jgi:hypothetical protein
MRSVMLFTRNFMSSLDDSGNDYTQENPRFIIERYPKGSEHLLQLDGFPTLSSPKQNQF